eukprot:CAMPEP_0201869036 /NCGR_PEP_ID=MMETSP0902-20130614/2704_1 /ASSEMBLY_ACC=CAM_ASM_000551 /TAXON_ID=420261 /ORGANISM="Thalassiosira antarctica, Strain CCMP982" /LENGTH=410 /DNA_ID=CAMNT_0048394473 /DNA_START=84 /DNA_END=1316 /DNA_ORIENTATION=-
MLQKMLSKARRRNGVVLLFCLMCLPARVSSLSAGSSSRNIPAPVDLTFGSILQSQESALTTGNGKYQYWCDPCSCGFNKAKGYKEHLCGKRHQAVIDEGDMIWKEYSSLRDTQSVFYDESVSREDVTRAWSLDRFISGLQARSRSSQKHLLMASDIGSTSSGGNERGSQLDPHLRLCDLIPTKRAELWRYVHASSSGIAGLAGMVAALPPRYVRVKELLESVEVYKHVDRLIKRSSANGQKAKRLSRLFDVGCGHGLVGMMVAAEYPNIMVQSIDLVPRDSFLAQLDAFRSTGTAIDNLSFLEGDLSVIANDEDTQSTNTLVICVHGCKELTHESIELAKHNGWAWLSVPCCLQQGDHLDAKTSLKLKSDQMRFTMLCGAIAANYQPDTVSTIPSCITARGIVLASGGDD